MDPVIAPVTPESVAPVTTETPGVFAVPSAETTPASIAAGREATLRASSEQGRFVGSDHEDTSAALDRLLAQASAPPAADPPPAPVPAPVPAPAAETPAPTAPVTETPVPGDIFHDVALPPKASPKSNEAFAIVKERARKEIERVNALLKEAQSKPPEKVVDEAAAKELAELREFRARMDVKADPSFREFESRRNKAEEFIYKQLEKSGKVNAESIAKIREMGGVAGINLGKFLESLGDSNLTVLVQAKFAEMETARFDQEQAVKDAEGRATEFLKEREAQLSDSRKTASAAAKTELGQLMKQVDWMREKPGDDAHNAQVKQMQAEMEQAVVDDSARMRAILTLGMARLSIVDKALAIRTKELADAQASLATLQKQMDGIKAASARIKAGGAPVDHVVAPPVTDNFGEHTTDALDKIAQQITAERARARQNG